MTKTITRQQIAGSQGEAFVRERAHDMGFLFNPYGQPEAGIDGLLELRDPATGEVKGQLVAAQVKTRDDDAYTAETDTAFEYLLDARDVEYWREGAMSEATQGRPAAQEFERAGATTAQASFEKQALSSIQRVQRFLHSYPTIVPFVVLMLGVLLDAAVNFSHFVTATDFSTVLTQVTIVGILAIGQTFVILTAGIDLSVGVTMVISSIVMGRLAVVDGLPIIGASAPAGLRHRYFQAARRGRDRRKAGQAARRRGQGVRSSGGASRSRVFHSDRISQSDGAVHLDCDVGRRRQAHRLRQDAGRAECAEISLRRVPEEIRPDQGAVAVYGAEGQVAPNPESLAFRCRDLVPNPLGGDLPFDLGKGRAR
jgi:Domain of unknown function (DUF4365)